MHRNADLTIQYCRGEYDITSDIYAADDADGVRWWTQDDEVALSIYRSGDHEPWSVTSALPFIPSPMLKAYADAESALNEYIELTS